jgi:hypothetical protein
VSANEPEVSSPRCRTFCGDHAARIRPQAIDDVVAAIGCLEKQRGLASVTEPLLG